jgi:hypothetical protein
MDLAMAGFAAYQLVNFETGSSLYQTTATQAEILQANANLKLRGMASRYVPAGSFTMPNLHSV